VSEMTSGEQVTEHGAFAITGCIIDKGTMLASLDGGLYGVRVEAGGSILAGFISLRDGAVIRTLPEGGFYIGEDLGGEEIP